MEKDEKKGAWRVSASADTSGSLSLGTHWKCVCVCVFVVCVFWKVRHALPSGIAQVIITY